MASYRISVALDVIADHDLIGRLVELQQSKGASAVVREALRAYFGEVSTLEQVLKELRELKELLSREGATVISNFPPTTQQPTSESDAKLNKALSRFRRD